MSGYVSFVVKGSVPEAFDAARAHGIEWTPFEGWTPRVAFVHAVMEHEVTLCASNTGENQARLAAWYHETSERPPFPAGTLLVYSVHPEEYEFKGEPDWLVLSIEDRGPGEFYRWRVKGENASATERYGAEFSWDVPDVTDRRYAAHPRADLATRLALTVAKGF